MFLFADKNIPLSRTVLICNLISGYCLEARCQRRGSKWQRVLCVLQECYEFVLNLAFFMLTSLVAWVVLISNKDSANFAAFINSIRGVLFATYICFSSLFLKFSKKQLMKIFKETSRVANLDKFRQLQRQCLAKTAKRTFCVYFLLPLAAAYFSVVMNFALTVMVVYGYYEDKVFEPDHGKDSEKIYTTIDPFKYIRILAFLVFCYLKQTSHDAIFLHLYCFVAEELRTLRQALRKMVRENQQLISANIDPVVPMAINIESWMDFQQTLARLMRKINSFAYPYIIVMAGYNAGILCITAYLFSKLTDSPAFKLAVFGYMMNSIIRISLFCEAGHRLRKEGLAICDVIYRAPVLRSAPSFGLALHSVALDCQRSFVARGGPFFTLSVEFFTSVAGAVLTYFVVLIQFK